ncbi:MAG: hypothetical protein IAE80_17740 [Anaerolinea sp.]|nr:hypothetical protein [Anaerolinea sp.]
MRAAVISIAMLLTAVPSLVEAVELSTGCTAKSVAEFNPPAESGTLLLQAVANPLAEGRAAAPAVRVLQPPLDQAMLSPNGEYIAGTRRHDNRANPTGSYTTVVINREFELVYEGASAFAEFYQFGHWLGNEQLMTIMVQRTVDDYDIFSYFLIDPFTQTYEHVLPDAASAFYYADGESFVERSAYAFTFDGRFFFTLGGQLFYDFEQQQPLYPEHFLYGIRSTTSQRLLSPEYTSFDLETLVDDVQSIFIYDFEADTLTPLTELRNVDRAIAVIDNSWSPDEAWWAYALVDGDAALFQPVFLRQLEAGNSIATCLGLPSTEFSTLDFAWSRDSRYLAVQGVLEGEAASDSLGVYVYDTQTGDIYGVADGSPDIIGWLAAPAS